MLILKRLGWIGILVFVCRAALAQPAEADRALRASVERAVTRLYAAYAGGDLAAFEALWVPGHFPAADEPALARTFRTRSIEIRELELLDVCPRPDGSVDAGVAVAIKKTDRVTHGSRTETEHRLLHLVRDGGDGWLVESWISRDRELANTLAVAPDEAVDRILAAHAAEAGPAMLRMLTDRVILSINQAKMDEARRGSARLSRLAAASGDPAMRSLALGAEGLVLRYSSDLQGSVARSQESLALADQSEDAQTIGRALLNLARAIEYAEGDQRNAVPYFERMLRMADRFDTTSLAARAATELSFLNLQRGDFRTSLRYLEIAREAVGEHDLFGLFGVELTLGDIYLSEGDGQLGLTHYQRAYDVAREVGFVKGEGSALVGMATGYLSLGDREHFRAVTAEGLRISRDGPEPWLTSKLLTNSALEAIDRDNLEAAESALKESLVIAERAASPSAKTAALDTMALLRLRQKHYADAIEIAGRASALETQLRDGSRFDAWIVAARAYRALHRPEEASRKLHEAIELAELSREGISGSERQSRLFFASRVTAYLDLVDLLVEQGKVGEALEVAERAKGRTLLDVLGSGGGAPALSVEENSREAGLREAVAAANRALLAARSAKKPRAEIAARDQDVAGARLALEAFYTSIDVTHPRLRRERAAAAAGSAAMLGRVVPRGAVAIEFVATEARTHAFVISRRADGGVHIRAFVVPVRSEVLRRKVNLLVSRLASRNLGYLSGARELYRLLLRPAARELASRRTVCIVPDGPLWALPFEALVAPDGRFAVERGAMFYVPSLGVLREMSRPAHTAAATQATFFGVGDPQVDGQTASHIQSLTRGADLQPLPGAAEEVEAIARLYGPRRSAVVTGAAAQEERVKREAGAYRVIHFATHGVIDDRNPMYSHLVMARFGPDDPNDGLLEAWEMMQLHLDARLTVLSACDTARGSVEAGEGLIGMTWALFAAGCPATIASAWKVDSEATRQLMVAFHRQWLRAAPSPFAKAEALRRARLSILRTPRYQHPYFWAPFILVGVPD